MEAAPPHTHTHTQHTPMSQGVRAHWKRISPTSDPRAPPYTQRMVIGAKRRQMQTCGGGTEGGLPASLVGTSPPSAHRHHKRTQHSTRAQRRVFGGSRGRSSHCVRGSVVATPRLRAPAAHHPGGTGRTRVSAPAHAHEVQGVRTKPRAPPPSPGRNGKARTMVVVAVLLGRRHSTFRSGSWR